MDKLIGALQLDLLMEFIRFNLLLKHGDTVQWATMPVEGALEDAHDSADGGGDSQAPGSRGRCATAPGERRRRAVSGR